MWDELNGVIDALAPPIRQAVLTSVARMKRNASLNGLTLAWANGDVDAVVYLLMGESTLSWAPLRAAVSGAIADAAVDHVSLYLRPGGTLLNIFTGLGTDPRITQAVQARLVTEIDRTTRRALTEWVRTAIGKGQNPEGQIGRIVGLVNPTTGRREGGVLGLTTRQIQAVENFQRLLRERKWSEALDRALRDKRYDPTLMQAYINNTGLSEEQITRMVARYEARMLAYRARTIARTESARAHSEGQRQAWDTAIRQGVVSPGKLIKRWVTAADERVRHHHAEMHNAVIPYDKFFIVQGGSLKNPKIRYVFGPPDEPNCRCVLSVRPILDPNTAFSEYAHGQHT